LHIFGQPQTGQCHRSWCFSKIHSWAKPWHAGYHQDEATVPLPKSGFEGYDMTWKPYSICWGNVVLDV
jgi:hypothetical protein